MTLDLDFSAIDIDTLRKSGGVKWAVFPDTIGAFVAEMDFGTAPAVTAALHEAVDKALFGYMPPQLATAMSEATSSWHRDRYGWEVAAERIHPIPDVLYGLQLAIEHYSAPGAPVILPTPAYMPFFSVPKNLGREIIEVPLHEENGRYRLDLDALQRAYDQGGNLLILCNPYNPVGRVFTREELEALSAVVERNGGRVFSDEIHAPLVFGERRHVPYASVSDAAARHTVTATSASKAWNLPGLKCAQFVISSDADAAVWDQKIGHWGEHGASNLGVIANAAAYAEAREWQASVGEYLEDNSRYLGDLLREHLPEMGYTPPEGTYIAWLDARALGLGDHPAAFFREHAGVVMTDGIDCGAPGAGYMRFVFAMPRPIIEDAVVRMADAYRRHLSEA